jgi:predicted ArsR family transcriptional regulator
MNIPHETRRESYERAQETAPRWRDEVLKCLKIYGPMSAFQLAERIGKPVYQVRPRITELYKAGLIADCDKRISPEGRTEAVWSAEPREPRADRNQFLLNIREAV